MPKFEMQTVKRVIAVQHAEDRSGFRILEEIEAEGHTIFGTCGLRTGHDITILLVHRDGVDFECSRGDWVIFNIEDRKLYTMDDGHFRNKYRISLEE